MALMGLLVFGRYPWAAWARWRAAREIEAGAVSTAQQWLGWAAWLEPNDGRVDLLRAVCFRHQHQEQHWRQTLRLADTNGASRVEIKLELALGLIRSGRIQQGDEKNMGVLIEQGVSPEDVAASFFHGYLACEDVAHAQMVLDAWEKDRPDSPHLAYVRGIHSLWLRDSSTSIVPRRNHSAQAEAELLDALSRQPRHEAARMTLAMLFEGRHQFDRALEQYGELAARFPSNETAKVSLARVLRTLGRLDEARAVMAPLASSAEPTADTAVEMGQLELEAGNSEKAKRWLSQAGSDQADDYTVSNATAGLLAIQGETREAEAIFSRIDAKTIRSARIGDLRDRLATGSGNKQTEDELRILLASTAVPSEDLVLSLIEPLPDDGPDETRATSAAELYEQYCAACHGANGNGQGRAARHLFPKPRDLRTGKALLVSTRNGIPTREDIEAVIENGLPGTSMESLEGLSEDKRRLLAREALRLGREGIRSQMISLLKAEGEEIDEDEVRQVVQECTTAGEVVSVPRIAPADSEAISRGKDTYFELGCQHCHGDDGVGVEDNPVYDHKGRLTRPRDLVHELFKGDREPSSVYLRIVLGMPGSPHPATAGASEDELVNLVQYCGSLSREPKLVMTNLERANRTAGKKYFSALSRAGAPEFGGAKSRRPRTTKRDFRPRTR